MDIDVNRTVDSQAAQRIADGFVSKSGTILGGLFTLPESLALVANAALPPLVKRLTEVSAAPIGNAFLAGAKALKLSNADKIGNNATKVAAMAIPYAVNIMEIASTARIHLARRNEIMRDVEPLSTANREAHKAQGTIGAIGALFDNGISDNKMIKKAQEAVREETYNNLTRDAAKFWPTFTLNYSSNLQLKINKLPVNEHGESVVPDNMQKQINLANWMSESSGVVEQAAANYLNSKDGSRVAKTSFGKVRQLQEYIRTSELDSRNITASSSDVAAVADRVEDIIQTYQKEQKYKPIPTHPARKIADAIASELVGGDMHVLSLVNIIGQERLLNANKNGFVSDQQVLKVFEEEKAILSKSSTITSQEFLQDKDYTIDDLKNHLASKDKDERALAVVLHPDSILMEAGLKKDEIKDLRAHLSGRMLQGIFSKVLNQLTQLPEDELQSMGLDRRDIVYLNEHEGQPIAAEMRNKSNLEQMKSITAKVLMGEESTAWRDAIAAGKAAAVKKADHRKGPAANDGSHAMAERKRQAANDAAHTLTADGSPAR